MRRRTTSQQSGARQASAVGHDNELWFAKAIVRLRTKGRKRFCVKLELGFIDNTLGMRDSARILLSSKGLTMLGFNDVLA